MGPIRTRERPFRPFVHVNLALDDGGRMAASCPGAASISCEEDWRRVHLLRERYAGVAVGAKTWLLDRPRLTARCAHLGREPRRQPDVVVFVGGHECAIELDGRRVFFVGSKRPSVEGVIAIQVEDHALGPALRELDQSGVKSILVEGGMTLVRSFVAQSVIDHLTVFVRTGSVEIARRAVRRALPDLDVAMTSRPLGQGVLMGARFADRRDPPLW